MGDEFSLEDALIILQRRFLYFLIPVLVIAPIGVLTVMLLPAKYTAKGTILLNRSRSRQNSSGRQLTPMPRSGFRPFASAS